MMVVVVVRLGGGPPRPLSSFPPPGLITISGASRYCSEETTPSTRDQLVNNEPRSADRGTRVPPPSLILPPFSRRHTKARAHARVRSAGLRPTFEIEPRQKKTATTIRFLDIVMTSSTKKEKKNKTLISCARSRVSTQQPISFEK